MGSRRWRWGGGQRGEQRGAQRGGQRGGQVGGCREGDQGYQTYKLVIICRGTYIQISTMGTLSWLHNFCQYGDSPFYSPIVCKSIRDCFL